MRERGKREEGRAKGKTTKHKTSRRGAQSHQYSQPPSGLSIQARKIRMLYTKHHRKHISGTWYVSKTAGKTATPYQSGRKYNCTFSEKERYICTPCVNTLLYICALCDHLNVPDIYNQTGNRYRIHVGILNITLAVNIRTV